MAKRKKSKAKGQGNRFKEKAHKGDFLHNFSEPLATKGDAKNTAIETVKAVVIGVIGGGLAGAAIGKPSFLVGLGVTGIGHYTGNPMATLFGVGLMAANGFQSKSVSGFEGMDGVKERVLAYGQELKEKLYLDKVAFLNKEKEESANGIGDLQYFDYGNEMKGASSELSNELAALDEIEHQIENSGLRHMQVNGIGVGDVDGYEDVGEVGELGEMGDLNDISDRIL